MGKYIIDKVENVIETGTALSEKVESKEITLNNYQSAKVVITTGEGETATTKASVVAILPDATEEVVKYVEITIGENAESIVNIVADEIAKKDAITCKVVIDAVADTTVTCGAVAILSDARYSE